MSRYGITKRYKIPKLMLAPIPASPLLTLFSNVARHMAHCAYDEMLPMTKKHRNNSILSDCFTL